MELNMEARAEMRSWIDTLAVPAHLRENTDAASKEIGALQHALVYAGATTPDAVREVFSRLKAQANSRTWPTPKELSDVGNAVRIEGATHSDVGNRQKLSMDERSLLETKILPTARRWLNDPAFRSHAESTLRFWGEAFPEDHAAKGGRGNG